MKIILKGVETNNKGAELMLYAILQEIERKYPNAIVYLSKDQVLCNLDAIKTSLKLKFVPFEQLERKIHLTRIYRSFHLPYMLLPHMCLMGSIDYLIDGSGFAFSDQFDLNQFAGLDYNNRYYSFKTKGTKIVFLPQAFGPFEKPATKNVLAAIGKYADIIMPREKVSYSYLERTGLVNMEKVKVFTDFTSLVDGEVPSNLLNLKNGICIIPNRQMINKGAISLEKYMHLLKIIIEKGKETGKPVYLLNHEGEKDEELCYEIKKMLSDDIEIVTRLDALKVKGLISTAYIVISSRFHGVASALNSCVPCLATSWSHKYEALFADYNIENCILPLDEPVKVLSMIDSVLDKAVNSEIRQRLSSQIPIIKEETKQMWKEIWKV